MWQSGKICEAINKERTHVVFIRIDQYRRQRHGSQRINTIVEPGYFHISCGNFS